MEMGRRPSFKSAVLLVRPNAIRESQFGRANAGRLFDPRPNRRIASGLTPKAKPNELEKRIGKVIKSNGSERRVLIEILGYCGALKPTGRCGFLQAFTSDEDRDRPPDHTNDWSYPVIWWQGADGVNSDA